MEQKYTVTVPIIENGVRKYVQEERTRIVDVVKTRQEERAKSIEVPDFAVDVHGQFESLGTFVGNRKVALLEAQLGRPFPAEISAALMSSDIPDQVQAIEVNRFLAQAGFLSDVTFMTSRSGAVIIIQPMDESEPKRPIGTSTVQAKRLPYGYYWVWAKRETRETDRQFAEIVQDPDEVFVDE